jgi:hypothetical protein
MEKNKDEMLWIIAKRRVSFKRSLAIYFLVNSFLCAIWYITIGKDGGHFWPVWGILGWGFALAIQYSYAYNNTGVLSTEKEFEKLKNEQK